MNIIHADKKDLPEILLLQKLAYQSEAILNNDFNIPPLHQTLADIEIQYESYTILKLSLDGLLVGSVRAVSEGAICNIGRLAVHPEYQGKGLGSALLKEIERKFPHCEEFRLFTGVKSIRNISLYTRLGYSITSQDAQLVFMAKRNATQQAGPKR